MASTPAPQGQSLSQSLATIIQNQLAQLSQNPKTPAYNFSNLNQNIIDPTQYATGLSNAQYDPQIAALQHQINTAGPQSKLDQSNITDWFKQAQNTYNAGAINSANQYDSASKQLAGSAAAFMSALGGSSNPGNPGIADQAMLQQNMLAGNRQADVNLDSNMAGLIPLSAAQAHLNEQNRYGSLLSDLNSQLGSAKGAKSSAYQAAFQEATGKKYDQLSGLDQAKFTAANTIFNDLMSQKGANTQSAAAAMNAIITQMQLPGQLTAQDLNNTFTKGKITNLNKTTSLLSGGVNLNKPGDVQGLQANIAKIVLRTTVDPVTGATSLALGGSPTKMWESVKGQLQNYKSLNPRGLQVMRNWFKSYLPKGWFFDQKGNLTNNVKVAQEKKLSAAAEYKKYHYLPPGFGSVPIPDGLTK